MSDIYKFDDLLNRLEKIRKNGGGALNYPNAFYCLALEIAKLKLGFLEASSTYEDSEN